MAGAARIRFAIFAAVVLGAPAALMSRGDPQLAQLGSLVMILSPAVAGLLLGWGLKGPEGPRRWPLVAVAGVVTLTVASAAFLAAWLGGAVHPGPKIPPTAVAATLVTSVLEEIGWAIGGVRLAVAAFGRRYGVPLLGVVWAAWHLIPARFGVMFPELQRAPIGMIAAFVAACVVYRELFTVLQTKAGTWIAAAVAHAVPNLALASVMALGFNFQPTPWSWWLWPAPGGLVFLLVALQAWRLARRIPDVSR